MRRKLEPSEIRTLLILGVGLLVGVASIYLAAREPMTPGLQRIVDATCPHWTEC